MEDSERIGPGKVDIVKERFGGNLVYQEHLARYNFIKDLAKGKAILEVGCGIGDGTRILSGEAKKIIGMEMDKAAVSYAHENYGGANIRHLVMDGCRLAFRDGTFDMVVCFEVIEHLTDQDRLLSEIRRVLKAGGTAIISTPNKLVIEMEGTAHNPLHVKELTADQFGAVLKKYFSPIELYGQKRGIGVIGTGRVFQRAVRAIDFLGLRRLVPQKLKFSIFNMTTRATGAKDPGVITASDFDISSKDVKFARNIIAICKK